MQLYDLYTRDFQEIQKRKKKKLIVLFIQQLIFFDIVASAEAEVSVSITHFHFGPLGFHFFFETLQLKISNFLMTWKVKNHSQFYTYM